MKAISDFNDIVPFEVRKRLNDQRNRIRVKGSYDANGRIVEPFIYVVGLGEKHFKSFDREIRGLIERFPWTRRKHIRLIMNELVINTQFSMLRQVVKNVEKGQKTPAYFYVVVYPSEQFFSASIQEFGDFFDYYGYLDDLEKLSYDAVNEEVYSGAELVAGTKVKIILTRTNDLRIADESNQIALNIIEKATDQDFYVTSFFKDGMYMWKRIYFRVENHEEITDPIREAAAATRR
jgi:hypothetical protein